MRTRIFGFAATALIVATAAISSAPAGQAAPQPPTAGSSPQKSPKTLPVPYPKTWLILPWGELADQSDANIERIATAYDWINTHGGSWFNGTALPLGGGVAERLRQVNPGIILTNYRNGSYTNQFALDEAGDVERRIPLSIAVHDTSSRLVEPVSATQTTLVLRPPAGPIDSRVPPAARAVYPFKASTTGGPYTVDKRAYVAWLRVGDEIMRVNEVAATATGAIELTVARGHWGTTATTHGQNDVVLQPIYNGRFNPNGNEVILSGIPDGNGSQPGLRYVMMQQRPEYWAWLGDKVGELFKQGYDGPWFDTSTSEWINHSNAYGVPQRLPYDVDLGRNLDNETFREYQQRKFDALFKQRPDGQFYANWNFPSHYFSNGTERLMFSGENGYHPISGGAIEQFANPQFMEWFQTMAMALDMAGHDYRGAAWAKGLGMTPQYQRYAYASYLLAFQRDGELYFGIDPDPADPQTPSIYPDIPRPEFQSVVPDPPSYVYWDLGAPLATFTDIAEAELVQAKGVYGRQFSCGLVLVNPDGQQTREVALERSYHDPISGQKVDTVTLAPQSASILLDPCRNDVPVAGACTDVITGTVSGPLTVSTGVTCLDGATIQGPVRVTPGAGLVTNSARISGPITATSGTGLTLCGTTVSGSVTSTGSALVVLGHPEAGCASNTVSGPVTISGTQGLGVLAGNSIRGPLSCTGNDPSPVNRGRPNDVRGHAAGQCSAL